LVVTVADVATLNPQVTVNGDWLNLGTTSQMVVSYREVTQAPAAWSQDVVMATNPASLPAVAAGTTVEARVKLVQDGRESAWTLSAPVVILGLTAPANLRSTSPSTDYSGVSLAWDAVAGATSYKVDLLNEAGTSVVASATVAGTTHRFAQASGRYQVRVQALAGSVSGPYSAAIRWRIGSAQVSHVETVTKTRPWTGEVINVGRWGKDGFRGAALPANVRFTQMSVNLSVSFSGLVAGTATRRLWSVVGGVDFVDLGSRANPWVETFPFEVNTAGFHGLRLRGTGWSADNSANQYVATGTIQWFGIETYTESTTVIDAPAVPSAPW
jgi:hypothetical protein